MTPSIGKRWPWLAVIGYVILFITGIASLIYARQTAVMSLGGSQDRQAWEQWREEARRQQGTEGTVQRRVPKSTEPPALVLLRDHFGTCLAGSFFLTTVLYWSTLFFVRGAFFGPKFQVDVIEGG